MPDSDPEIQALIDAYSRNREFAKRGSYQTRLSPGEEQEFQAWVWKNKIPFDLKFPPDQAMQDYDMRGYWKALKTGAPLAAQDAQTRHFPDIWKTPYHHSFSNQSMYATEGAPQWVGNKLVDQKGNVVWTEPNQ